MIKLKPVISSTIILFIALCWGNSLYIYLKAGLAQRLISKAWETTLQTGEDTKPWPWADTWPVGRLASLSTGDELFVLEGASGAVLAFGPGRISRSVSQNTTIISGHRDTHFSFLEQLKQGDTITLEEKSGRIKTYTIQHTQVNSTENGHWLFDASKNALHLITCYPFNAPIPGGPLRYVVVAKPAYEPVDVPLT